MKNTGIFILLVLTCFLLACGEDNSDQNKIGGIVNDKFEDKKSAGVDVYAVGKDDDWTLEIDFEKDFVFDHPAEGLHLSMSFSKIGEDVRGDRGVVYTYNDGSRVLEVSTINDKCGEDGRSFHTLVQYNPEISEKLILFKGCGYNLNKR